MNKTKNKHTHSNGKAKYFRSPQTTSWEINMHKIIELGCNTTDNLSTI